MSGGIASGAVATSGAGMSTRTTSPRSSPTRSTAESPQEPCSSQTSPLIPVDRFGWPIVEVRRAVWKWPLCQHCHQMISVTLVPLDNLGRSWWQDVDTGKTGIFLCQKCYRVARSAFGRIMGYTMKDGKTSQYVKEELFGGEVD